MKRCLAGIMAFLILTVIQLCTAWADDSGLVVIDTSGVAQGSVPPTSDTGLSGVTYGEDGGMIVESGQLPAVDDQEESSPGLTQEEWEARMRKAIEKNGAHTDTTYRDPDGNQFPAEVLNLGLGRSDILVNGVQMTVPTTTLSWLTEAPEDKVLAVVNPNKQSYATLRATKNKKGFVMSHCEKCRVVRVISIGKTWTKVDCDGMRGYVLTSALDFYNNGVRIYRTGIITFKGKIDKNNPVHIRSANTNTAKQLAEFACGTPLTVFAQDGRWTEVDVGGWHGYILTEFVTLDEVKSEASAG